MKYKDFIYLEEDAMMWAVVLQEDDGTAITLFQGLKRKEAERLKERIDNAIRRRLNYAIKELYRYFGLKQV